MVGQECALTDFACAYGREASSLRHVPSEGQAAGSEFSCACISFSPRFSKLVPETGAPPFKQIQVDVNDEPIVVDWDNDGDLDVIVVVKDSLHLFEMKSGSYEEAVPNPFEGMLAVHLAHSMCCYFRPGGAGQPGRPPF